MKNVIDFPSKNERAKLIRAKTREPSKASISGENDKPKLDKLMIMRKGFFYLRLVSAVLVESLLIVLFSFLYSMRYLVSLACLVASIAVYAGAVPHDSSKAAYMMICVIMLISHVGDGWIAAFKPVQRLFGLVKSSADNAAQRSND